MRSIGLEQLVAVGRVAHRARRHGDPQLGPERVGPRGVAVERAEHARDRVGLERAAGVDTRAEARDLEQALDLGDGSGLDVGHEQSGGVGAEIDHGDTRHVRGRASARRRSTSDRSFTARSRSSCARTTSAAPVVTASSSRTSRRDAPIAARAAIDTRRRAPRGRRWRSRRTAREEHTALAFARGLSYRATHRRGVEQSGSSSGS